MKPQSQNSSESKVHCRFCNFPLNMKFVDLGLSPLANSFLDKNSLCKDEPYYPLRAFVCEQCFLVQVEQFESSENIFSNYAYFSSFSESWLKHVEEYTNMMITRFGFNEKSLVIEIASNDGYLLQYFKKQNIPILGIEPAVNVAKVAEDKGIPTIVKFFGTKTARDLENKGKMADLLIGNNVLAHVHELNDFVEGLRIILKENGIITMEFPHILQLIMNNQFDTIYHEHFSYFSLIAISKIFSSHKLSIFDVEEIPTHGGSLRIYVKHESNNKFPIGERVNLLLQKEIEYGLTDISTYTNFEKRVNSAKQKILDFFISTKKQGKKIVCYGAAAKGNTLLNYCNIKSEFVEYTVDRSPHKQGLYLPGTHIPIKDPKIILETKPDYVVIIPWNLKDEIMTQMNYIRSWGGKFVVLIPEVEVYP